MIAARLIATGALVLAPALVVPMQLAESDSTDQVVAEQASPAPGRGGGDQADAPSVERSNASEESTSGPQVPDQGAGTGIPPTPQPSAHPTPVAPATAGKSPRLADDVSSDVGTVVFKLTTAIDSSEGRGAWIRVSGTRLGVQVVEDFRVSSDNASWPGIVFDRGTTVHYIINYYSKPLSGSGTGMGKITGDYVVGTSSSQAMNVRGGNVTVAVSVEGSTTSLLITNPMDSITNELADAYDGILFNTVPIDAIVELRDNRDNSRIPVFSSRSHGGNRMGVYAPGIPVTQGTSNSYSYQVSRDGYVSATGTVTLTCQTSGCKDATYSADINDDVAEGSFLPPGSYPQTYPVLNLTLEVAQREYTDLFFDVAAGSTSAQVSLASADGTTLAGTGSTFRVPRANFDSTLNWQISAPGYRGLGGSVHLDQKGLASDQTGTDQQDLAITYAFDQAQGRYTIQLRPQADSQMENSGSGYFDIKQDIMSSFADRIHLEGSTVVNGEIEITNTLNHKVVLTDVDLIGQPALGLPMLRTLSEAFRAAYPADYPGPWTWTMLRDVVTAASQKYGQNFASYSDYLLYYFRQNLSGKNIRDYSDLTDLRDLDPRDIAPLYAGNAQFRAGNPLAEWDIGPYEDPGMVVRKSGGSTYMMQESDPVLTELGHALLFNHGLYFTLDETRAPNGRLPTALYEPGEYAGLQYQDYRNHTPENREKVAEMLRGVVLEPGESHLFSNVAVAALGNFLHNGYLGNYIDFPVTLRLKLQPVGIDGYIFADSDGDGARSETEQGYADITVSVTEAGNAKVLASTKTDESGYYLLPQGESDGEVAYEVGGQYVTRFQLPKGGQLTDGPGVGDPRRDSRFSASGRNAVSETVDFVENGSERLNGGLVQADQPIPPTPPTPPTPPSTSGPWVQPTPDPTTGPTKSAAVGTGMLSATGFDSRPWLAFAAVLLMAGAMAAAIARRHLMMRN